MQNLETTLAKITKIDGVKTAVVVSRDGFVIEGVSNNGLDTEAVAAIISGGIVNSETMSGRFAQSMSEYDKVMIVVNPLGEKAALAVVASDKASLGHLRYQLKKFGPEIEEAL